MSTPNVAIPKLPNWWPNLGGESHAVQMAHQLTYQLIQQHEQAIILLKQQQATGTGTTTVNNTTVESVAAPLATSSSPGIVQPDDTTITIDDSGIISAPGGTSSGPAVPVYYRKALGFSVSVTAHTPTEIDSITINPVGGASPAFPSVGTWRVLVSYSYYGAEGSGVAGETQVKDGAGNVGACSEGGQFSGTVGTNYQGCGFMPVTYTGSSAETFTVNVENTGSQTIDTASVLLGNPSYMEIAILPA